MNLDCDSDRSTTDRKFELLNVESLKKYLKDRNVPITQSRKADLIELCQAAHKLGLEIDPEGLQENRNEIARKKILISGEKNETYFLLPTLPNTFNDSSSVPEITLYDITSYLSISGTPVSKLRNPTKLDGYMLFKDGYVIDLSNTRTIYSK